MQIENKNRTCRNYKKRKARERRACVCNVYLFVQRCFEGVMLLAFGKGSVRAGLLPLRKSGMDLTTGWRLVVRRWNDLAGGCSKDDDWLLEQVESNEVISKEAWAWERYRRERGAQIHVHKNREKTRMSNEEKRESERKRKSQCSQSKSYPTTWATNKQQQQIKRETIYPQFQSKKLILFHSPPKGLVFLSVF